MTDAFWSTVTHASCGQVIRVIYARRHEVSKWRRFVNEYAHSDPFTAAVLAQGTYSAIWATM